MTTKNESRERANDIQKTKELEYHFEVGKRMPNGEVFIFCRKFKGEKTLDETMVICDSGEKAILDVKKRYTHLKLHEAMEQF